MTIHWKVVEQYFTVVLFVFQFYPVCNVGKFINFGLGTVKSETFDYVAFYRGYSFERNCVLRRWESETLK